MSRRRMVLNICMLLISIQNDGLTPSTDRPVSRVLATPTVEIIDIVYDDTRSPPAGFKHVLSTCISYSSSQI